MGCGNSTPETVDAPTAANHVDDQLAEAAAAERFHFKVLLLGAGESGKSTFGKQLKLLNRGALHDKEKALYRKGIRQNLVQSMQTLVEAAESLEIPLVDSRLQEAAERVQAIGEINGDMTPALGRDIADLWADEGIQKTWANKAKFWILDSTPYYMKEATRLSRNDFTVTEEDVLMTRLITTGVGMIEVSEPPFCYKVVDVGGQRNERKKWMHCFDDVKAVVFFISLAGYNQVMFEDSSQNRLLEALDLYEQVVSNPVFRDTLIHVLLNKTDLFEDMIKDVPLTTCFPDYTGPPQQVSPAISFIEGKCKSILARCCPNKECTVTPICARVRKDVKHGWREVTELIRETHGADPKR